MRAPVVSDPLVEPLRPFASRSILRGVDTLPNNTVAVVKENRAVRRSVPGGRQPRDEQRAALARISDRHARHDLPALLGPEAAARRSGGRRHSARSTDGRGRSAANYPAARHRPARKRWFCSIRGDLIRRYGEILVVLNHAATSTYQHGQGTDSAPIFAGRLGDDLCYFGFDVARETVLADKARLFFVIFEAPGTVRFGLDIGSAQVRRDRFAFKAGHAAIPARDARARSAETATCLAT